MAYKAAVFDMDGTILDTLGDIADSVNVSLERAGFPPRSEEEVRRFVGNGAAKLVERAVPPGTPPETVREVLDFYRPYYEAHAQNWTRAYPGIPEALARLRAAGMKLAVVSNKPEGATVKLAERYFPGVFDAVSGAREGVPVKPAPDALNAVMAALGVTARETVYIGDSEVDLATADNAGTGCVLVGWGFRGAAFLREQGAPKLVVEDAEQLADILLSAGSVGSRRDL